MALDKIGAAFAWCLLHAVVWRSAWREEQHPATVLAHTLVLLGECARLIILLATFERQRRGWEAEMDTSLYLSHIATSIVMATFGTSRTAVQMMVNSSPVRLLALPFFATMQQSFMWRHWSQPVMLAMSEVYALARWLAYSQDLQPQDRWQLLLDLQICMVIVPWLCRNLQGWKAGFDAGRRPPPLTALSQAVDISQPVQKPYTSFFRSREKLLVTIPDPYQLRDLPPNTLAKLQQVVHRALARSGQPLELADIALRHGCILAVMDLIQSSDRQVDVEEIVRCIAEQLPELMEEITAQAALRRDTDNGAERQPGRFQSDRKAYVQLGSQRACLTWSPQQGVWQCSVESSPPGLSAFDQLPITCPELGLVLVAPGSSVSSQQPVTAASSSSRAPRSVSGLCGAGEVCWLLQVQLWDEEGAQAGQWRVQGSDPAVHPSPTAADDLQPAGESACALQLWAVGGTGYLRTHVLSCVRASKQAGQDTGCMIVEVLVCASRDQLLCHHHGGPPVVVQPVCLQLWRGDYWLHSSHSLLCVGQVSQGGELVQDSCSWWGASPAATCACVEELQALTHRLWHTGAAREEVVGQQLLLRDVTYWLSAVQLAAHEQAWCVCKAANNDSDTFRQVGPSGDTAARLAEHLLRHTSRIEYSLHSTHALVLTQSKFVPAVTDATDHSGDIMNDAQPSSGRWRARWQQLKASVAGYACPECEHLYTQQVHHHLSMVRACSSALSVMVCLAGLHREVLPIKQHLSRLILSIWGVLHLANIAQVMLQRHHGRPLYMGLAAVVVRYLLFTLSAVGIIRLPSAVQRQHDLGTWVVTYMVMELTCLVLLQGTVWQVVIAGCAINQAVSVYRLCNPAHSWVFNALGSIGVSLLVPLLVDMHVRRWVMAGVAQGAKGRGGSRGRDCEGREGVQPDQVPAQGRKVPSKQL